ncbi:VOC family protein [Candidatus Parcubacteria bacterium]|nr:VOC family protein [Candidatus Parcubacteria bacterium]
MLQDLNLLGLYVTDPFKTADFYHQLGFTLVKQDKDVAEVKLGQFRVQFVNKETARDQDKAFQKEAYGEPKGAGLYINVSVKGIDSYYQSLLDKNLRPSSQPRDWPWGNREFVIRDPDGYKLVFYERI